MAYCAECGEPIRSKTQRCWETGGHCYAEKSASSSSSEKWGKLTTSKTAMYKGKKYKVLFCGETKFGRRAHLAAFNGAFDFWVAESAIS